MDGLAGDVGADLSVLLVEVAAVDQEDVGVLAEEPGPCFVALDALRVIGPLDAVPDRGIPTRRHHRHPGGVVLRVLEVAVRGHHDASTLVRVEDALRPGKLGDRHVTRQVQRQEIESARGEVLVAAQPARAGAAVERVTREARWSEARQVLLRDERLTRPAAGRDVVIARADAVRQPGVIQDPHRRVGILPLEDLIRIVDDVAVV